MTRPPILLLYGLDENSHGFEIDSTLGLVKAATDALMSRGWRVMPLQVTHDLVTPLRPFDPGEWLVLNLCEGLPTQEFYYAKVTRTLAELGYTFTGSDAWSLEETQYKQRMKALLERDGVPTPRWAAFAQAEAVTFDVFPAIVKPASEHCSYGITRESVVMNLDEAQRQAARIIADFKQPVLIEEFLDSAEYNVSVWGPSTLSRSPGSQEQDAAQDTCAGIEVLGISTMTYDAFDDIHDRLCTFDAKWTPASEAYQRIPAICPAPVTAEMKAKIETVAIAAYRASGCRDYGRVDLRLRSDQPMALDINSNCDVSPDGGFANAARAAGLTYAQMLERIVELAIKRMPMYEPEPATVTALEAA
jgi:D-alanine-D-alanine ligase